MKSCKKHNNVIELRVQIYLFVNTYNQDVSFVSIPKFFNLLFGNMAKTKFQKLKRTYETWELSDTFLKTSHI